MGRTQVSASSAPALVPQPTDSGEYGWKNSDGSETRVVRTNGKNTQIFTFYDDNSNIDQTYSNGKWTTNTYMGHGKVHGIQENKAYQSTSVQIPNDALKLNAGPQHGANSDYGKMTGTPVKPSGPQPNPNPPPNPPPTTNRWSWDNLPPNPVLNSWVAVDNRSTIDTTSDSDGNQLIVNFTYADKSKFTWNFSLGSGPPGSWLIGTAGKYTYPPQPPVDKTTTSYITDANLANSEGSPPPVPANFPPPLSQPGPPPSPKHGPAPMGPPDVILQADGSTVTVYIDTDGIQQKITQTFPDGTGYTLTLTDGTWYITKIGSPSRPLTIQAPFSYTNPAPPDGPTVDTGGAGDWQIGQVLPDGTVVTGAMVAGQIAGLSTDTAGASGLDPTAPGLGIGTAASLAGSATAAGFTQLTEPQNIFLSNGDGGDYDQGQVSTSIYYENDPSGRPITVVTGRGGVPTFIWSQDQVSFDPSSKLQAEWVSNLQQPTRPLSISDAIPLGIHPRFQAQQPFRFQDFRLMRGPGQLAQPAPAPAQALPTPQQPQTLATAIPQTSTVAPTATT